MEVQVLSRAQTVAPESESFPGLYHCDEREDLNGGVRGPSGPNEPCPAVLA